MYMFSCRRGSVLCSWFNYNGVSCFFPRLFIYVMDSHVRRTNHSSLVFRHLSSSDLTLHGVQCQVCLGIFILKLKKREHKNLRPLSYNRAVVQWHRTQYQNKILYCFYNWLLSYSKMYFEAMQPRLSTSTLDIYTYIWSARSLREYTTDSSQDDAT